MNRILIFGSLFLIIISLWGLWNTSEKKDVLLNGKEIEVLVTEAPTSCNYRRRPTFKFKYDNTIHIKNAWKYCKTLNRGDVIKLKTNTENSIFVFTDEKIKTEIIACYFLLFSGIFCFSKGIYNSKLNTKNSKLK